MEGSSKQTANAALRRPAGSQFHIVLFVYVVAPGCSPNTISLQHFFLSYTKYAIYRGAYSHYKNSLSLGRRPCVLFVSIHSLCLLSYRPSIFSPLVSAFMRRANTTEQHNIFGFISLLLNSLCVVYVFIDTIYMCERSQLAVLYREGTQTRQHTFILYCLGMHVFFSGLHADRPLSLSRSLMADMCCCFVHCGSMMCFWSMPIS